MAKCVICTQKKGKRNCKIKDAYICSLCCGETRNANDCTGCPHYRETSPPRKYRDIPRFPLPRMGDDYQLQDYANAIEGTLSAFDVGNHGPLTDREAISSLELLLDKYYFKEQSPVFRNPRLEQLFSNLERSIAEDLEGLDHAFISKVVATIHFVAKRRTDGTRSYLEFIRQYVGIRMGKGTRIMTFPKY